MSRSGSVRLRSSLGSNKEDGQSGNEAKRRRLNNISNQDNGANSSASNNGNGNGKNGNGGGLPVNGSRTERPRTRGMEPEKDDNSNSNTVENTEGSSINLANNESSQESQNPVESSSSSSSDSSDSSDSEDSSDMDEVGTESKCSEFKDDLNIIEKQFLYVRELLYKERLKNIEDKIEEVRSGRAKEYLSPLEQLQDNMRVRIEVAGKLREYRTQNLKNKYEAEELASHQNCQSEKTLLFDAIKSDLEDKIHRLEEDRNNDFTSELWLGSALKRKNKKCVDIFGEKKKKPIVVSGPYVVYMLNDVDIVEDWTIIKKALAAPKRKYVEYPSF